MNGPKPDWGRKGTQPKGTLGPPPAPNGQLVATQPQHTLIRVIVWKPVECPECGKLICDAQPGSIIKVLCNRCKAKTVINVMA